LADSSTEAITSLWQALEAGIEDYKLLKDDNKRLLADCNMLWDRVADLESDLTEAKTSATRDIAALKTNVISADTCVMDEAFVGEEASC
jgi:hypothetical protein